jgi:hypothetical protein
MSERLCIDCDHLDKWGMMRMCNHPKAEREPVAGKPKFSASTQRERWFFGCGPDGNWFEPKGVAATEKIR